MDTKKLRQKILDLAIHGKLVPQDPNDEPASVLLDRIRAEKERLIAEGKIKRSKKSATSDTSHYENVPFEVPEGWCWCRLEDYFELLSGQDFPPEKYNDAQNGIPYIIGASNLYMGKIVINRWTQTPSVKTTKGDLLVVCKGAGVGKMALNDIGDMHIARQIQAIRDVSKMMSIEYIKMVVSYYIEDIIADANGLIPGLKRELLLSLLMPIPPLQEQRRIITTFEKLMSFIESIDNDSLELTKAIKIAQSKILDLAIHGRLVPQDANDEPASELLKRINPKAVASCDNPHYEQVPFEIPGNWAWIRIDEINKFKSKTVNPLSYPTSQFELYSVPTFETGEPEFPYGKDVASSKVEVEEGDVLLCKINPHLNRVWVVRRRMAQLKSLASSEWIVIRTDEIMPEYLALTMQSPYFRELMMSNVSGVGGSLMRAQPTFVKQYMIPIPPIREQERIIEKVAQFNLYIDTIASTLP